MPPIDPISSSSRKVQPFLAMEILERAQAMEREGVDIIHLEVGEPAHLGAGQRHVEIFRDRLGQRAVGVAGQQLHDDLGCGGRRWRAF